MYLNCHSYYSFRYGTLPVEELVKEALGKRIEVLALTDINTSTAVFPFIKACDKQGVRPVVGIEFRQGHELCFIGLARNMQGMLELNEFLSHHLQNKLPLPAKAPEFDHVFVVYPWNNRDPAALRDNEYIGLRHGELSRLRRSNLNIYTHRLVILHPVSFRGKEGFNTHRLLRAIDNNCLLSKLPVTHQAANDESMLDIEELTGLYSAWPQLIYNTIHLLDQCEASFEFGTSKNKKTFTGDPADDRLLLEKLAYDGWKYRYGKDPEALRRIEKELDIIHKLGFSPYFLITWDIIRYAQSRGFRHVGRGSGANSIVAYCLRITDVDPISLDLYFERFINPHRSSPPDFDIDFSWNERDEVIDYIFKRHGKSHTVLLATYNTFKGRSIIRELGKVFGLPKEEIDHLVRYPNDEQQYDHIKRMIIRYGKNIIEFPNYLSIHAGGILISEQPIYQYTATELPPKGFPTTQFDMYVAEEIGLYKYDILSQRGLGHIKDSVEIILENKGKKIDIDKVEKFKKDEKINCLLATGNTMGCFYIESPAMRQLLQKLSCSDFITLVAASSIIRPGVAKSGMMREYITRHHNPGKFEYLHPKMEELLKETHGVMVYQEDVIKVAHHFANIDLAEADILRRAMSGKFRSKNGFQLLQDKYFANCREIGYPDEISMEVWRQMESFSGYSFSKAHSASFAVESYQSLFLKTYFPKEFMVAVINNFGGFYSTETYINEARKAGALIHAPCVINSGYMTGIRGDDIYLGFIHLKDLEQRIAKNIETERSEHGPFIGMTDFIERMRISHEQLNILIHIGALRFCGKTKKELLWDAALYFGSRSKGNLADPLESRLFRMPVKEYKLPELTHTRIEDAYDEISLLGYPLSDPFQLLRQKPVNLAYAPDLKACANGRVRMAGYLVCTKDVRTSSGGLMKFGTFRDQKGDLFDTVHFPPSMKKYPFNGKGVYLMTGKVTLDFGVPAVEVDQMMKLAYAKDPRLP